MRRRSQRVQSGLAVVIVAMLVIDLAAVASHRWPRPGPITWTMVDVSDDERQGDAHVIHSGERTVLIDTGTYDLARSKLVPYLEEAGIARVDIVFVSHAHLDHYGGIRALIEARVEIGQVQISLPDGEVCRRETPWGCSQDDIETLLATLEQANIPVFEPIASVEWVLADDVSLELVERLDGDLLSVEPIDVNDTSMVLRLDVGETSVLFTGDLNVRSGRLLTTRDLRLSARDPTDLRLSSTVLLKVPHHGTASLPEDAFFAAVDPDFAFVPAPSALWHSERSSQPRAWLERHNVPTFVSGEAGHVRVHLGNRFRIETDRSRTPAR